MLLGGVRGGNVYDAVNRGVTVGGHGSGCAVCDMESWLFEGGVLLCVVLCKYMQRENSADCHDAIRCARSRPWDANPNSRFLRGDVPVSGSNNERVHGIGMFVKTRLHLARPALAVNSINLSGPARLHAGVVQVLGRDCASLDLPRASWRRVVQVGGCLCLAAAKLVSACARL